MSAALLFSAFLFTNTIFKYLIVARRTCPADLGFLKTRRKEEHVRYSSVFVFEISIHASPVHSANVLVFRAWPGEEASEKAHQAWLD
jgi:hypothetical protein